MKKKIYLAHFVDVKRRVSEGGGKSSSSIYKKKKSFIYTKLYYLDDLSGRESLKSIPTFGAKKKKKEFLRAQNERFEMHQFFPLFFIEETNSEIPVKGSLNRKMKRESLREKLDYE